MLEEVLDILKSQAEELRKKHHTTDIEDWCPYFIFGSKNSLIVYNFPEETGWINSISSIKYNLSGYERSKIQFPIKSIEYRNCSGIIGGTKNGYVQIIKNNLNITTIKELKHFLINFLSEVELESI